MMDLGPPPPALWSPPRPALAISAEPWRRALASWLRARGVSAGRAADVVCEVARLQTLCESLWRPALEDLARHAGLPGLPIPARRRDAAGESFVGTTWNPSDKASEIALSNDDLTAFTTSGSNPRGVRSVAFKTEGKFYVEVAVAGSGTPNTGNQVGIAGSAASLTQRLGISSVGWGYRIDGNKENNNSQSAFGEAFTVGDVIALAVELAAGAGACKLWWAKGATWQASGNPATGANPAYTFTLPSGGVAIAMTTRQEASPAYTLLTQPDHQAHAAPSGFTAGWPA